MRRSRILRDPVFVLVGTAIAWGILLLVLAGTLPVVTPQSPPGRASAAVTSSGTVVTTGSTVTGSTPERPRVTLVDDAGRRILGLVAVPTLAAMIVGVALRRRPGVVAWVLSAGVLLAGIVGFVTVLIGVAVVPMGILLLLACTQSAVSSRGTGAAPGRRAIPSRGRA